MRTRTNKVKLLLYPEDIMKEKWDIFITIVLFVSLVITPMRITFGPTVELPSWKAVGQIIDFFFLLDIFVNFNCSFYDNDFIIVENRKIIGNEYLKSWFLIDLISIVPFEDLFSTNA